MKNEIEVYRLPEYWASALINGDYSGMEESEIKEIDSFLSTVKGSCVSCSEEGYFAWSNDANNLGATCLDYSFLVPIAE